jgi:hypothetical protein
MFAASGYHLALSPEEWLWPDIFSQMVGGSNSLQLGTMICRRCIDSL